MSIIIVIASPTSGSYKLNNFTWGVAVSLSGYAMTGILKYIEFLIDAFNTGLSDHFISVLGDCHVRQVDSLGCCYHEGGLAMTIWMSIRHPIIRHSPSYYSGRFNLYQILLIYQSLHLNHTRTRLNRLKKFSMRFSIFFPSGDVGYKHSCSNHIF